MGGCVTFPTVGSGDGRTAIVFGNRSLARWQRDYIPCSRPRVANANLITVLGFPTASSALHSTSIIVRAVLQELAGLGHWPLLRTYHNSILYIKSQYPIKQCKIRVF